MLLAVDVGNTNITMALFAVPKSGEEFAAPQQRWALSTRVPRTPDEVRWILRALWADVEGLAAPAAIALGSVVPGAIAPLRDGMSELWPKAKLSVIESGVTPMPVRNAYERPTEVGVDRLANAVAGVSRYGSPIIVVDIGTAITFDIVDKEPCYLGGLILPGPGLAAEALNLRTARLPRVAPGPTPRVVGRSTDEAMRAGLYWGLVGALDRIVEEIEREQGWPNAVTVATGGDAAGVVKQCRRIREIDPDLTLRGFAEVWRFNAC